MNLFKNTCVYGKSWILNFSEWDMVLPRIRRGLLALILKPLISGIVPKGKLEDIIPLQCLSLWDVTRINELCMELLWEKSSVNATYDYQINIHYNYSSIPPLCFSGLDVIPARSAEEVQVPLPLRLASMGVRQEGTLNLCSFWQPLTSTVDHWTHNGFYLLLSLTSCFCGIKCYSFYKTGNRTSFEYRAPDSQEP